MHRATLLTLLTLSVSIFELSIGATTYEIEAKKFISDASSRYYNLYNKIAEETYTSTDDEDFEAVFSKFTTVNKIAGELVGISQEAADFDADKIQDAEIKHALKNLRMVGQLFVLGDDYFSSVLMSFAALKELSTDKDIEPYLDGSNMPDQDGSPLAYYPDIQKIIQNTNDTAELSYYWETFRTKNSGWSSINFYAIVEAFSKAAEILDVPVLDFWYRYYDNKNFIQDMEKVMLEMKPAYQQLHAFIRQLLFEKYGSSVIDPKAPIPDHLFQQVLEQTWNENSVLEAQFPHKELPPYNEFLKEFDAQKMITKAEQFYTSLGFTPLEEKFFETQFKKHDMKENEKNCRANIFDLTPQVFVKYCEKVDFKKFLQTHGFLGRVHYAVQKSSLPSYFFNSYDLEYPVGEAVILSASTPKHLAATGLAKDFVFTDQTLNNRLIRMAIHTMFNIPLFFVHTKVMNDLLNGTVTIESVNKHYWKLMETYVGVEPPIDRPEGQIDFPDKFYLDIEENYQTKKFVSEILGYQIYRSFCKKSEQLGQLNNCDFYGNLAVGNNLRKIMALGSSKPWKDVLAEILPKDETLSAAALLEYYAPILKWISAKNTESNVKIGWNNTKKKVL